MPRRKHTNPKITVERRAYSFLQGIIRAEIAALVALIEAKTNRLALIRIFPHLPNNEDLVTN